MTGRWVDVLVFALRIGIGGVLVAAGALKVGHANDLASTIAGFRILPQPLVGPMAIGLPYFELGLGVYLLIGLYTRVVAVVALAEFVVFAGAIASVVIRGIPIACGCFGQADTAQASWLDVVRDIALAALAGFIAWRAPGMLAVDRRMERS
ncbi:MAG TPA: MauE/DoxX family redox-associated membrane protein [Candidatus Binatia bacterium]|nr:MauE/DoxX family redox-associated membrane protein [Candidatus Binatia bacterium]